MDLAEFFAGLEDIWARRDACATHYPRPCPDDCPEAPIRDGK
jgi:hypothetical protein